MRIRIGRAWKNSRGFSLAGDDSGRIHNPSAQVDPDYWRFFVRTASHKRFMTLVGSWHPTKRELIETRMKIESTPRGDAGTNVNKVAVPEGAAGSPPF